MSQEGEKKLWELFGDDFTKEMDRLLPRLSGLHRSEVIALLLCKDELKMSELQLVLMKMNKATVDDFLFSYFVLGRLREEYQHELSIKRKETEKQKENGKVEIIEEKQEEEKKSEKYPEGAKGTTGDITITFPEVVNAGEVFVIHVNNNGKDVEPKDINISMSNVDETISEVEGSEGYEEVRSPKGSITVRKITVKDNFECSVVLGSAGVYEVMSTLHDVEITSLIDPPHIHVRDKRVVSKIECKLKEENVGKFVAGKKTCFCELRTYSKNGVLVDVPVSSFSFDADLSRMALKIKRVVPGEYELYFTPSYCESNQLLVSCISTVWDLGRYSIKSVPGNLFIEQTVLEPGGNETIEMPCVLRVLFFDSSGYSAAIEESTCLFDAQVVIEGPRQFRKTESLSKIITESVGKCSCSLDYAVPFAGTYEASITYLPSKSSERRSCGTCKIMIKGIERWDRSQYEYWFLRQAGMTKLEEFIKKRDDNGKSLLDRNYFMKLVQDIHGYAKEKGVHRVCYQDALERFQDSIIRVVENSRHRKKTNKKGMWK